MTTFSVKVPEDKSNLQPHPSVQPKARGLLHMERKYIAHHIRRNDSGLEHLIASIQPKKYSKDYPKRSKDSKPEQRNPEAPESARWPSSEVLDACRTRLKSTRGLVGSGAMRLFAGVEYSRIRDGIWHVPYPLVPTQLGVELVDIQGNYSIRLE